MITKPKTLSEQLANLPIGKEEEIKTALYRSTTVRRMVSILRQRGYKFVCTEKGCVNSIKVTRLA